MPRLLLTLLVFLFALTGGSAADIARYGTDTTDHAATALLLPPASISPVYDADGNLTDDGLRTYTWDAEPERSADRLRLHIIFCSQNRLLSVTTKDAQLPAGAPLYRVTYAYDDGGRRIAQTTEARTVPGGPWVLAHRRTFLYHGWQCVAEYDYIPAGSGATRTLFRSQVWGPSIGGGGAGGLLIVRRHTGPQAGTHFATHDGNGNVTALVDAGTGSESARYDYDPFGNLLRGTGPAATENPYRFSTQYTDDVTGLVYYGYRHYDPAHGRWLSRDPIGEVGGLNLYGFISNDGVNGIDVLGLADALYLIAPANQLQRSLITADDGGLYMFDPGSNVLAPVSLNGPIILSSQAADQGDPTEGLNPIQRGVLGALMGAQNIGNSVCGLYKGAWASGDSGGRYLKAILSGDTAYLATRYDLAVFWASYYGIIAKKLVDEPAFRSAVWQEMGPDLRQQFTTAEGLSEVAAQIGVSAAASAAGLQAAGSSGKLLAFVEGLMKNGKLQKFFCSSCGAVGARMNGGKLHTASSFDWDNAPQSLKDQVAAANARLRKWYSNTFRLKPIINADLKDGVLGEFDALTGIIKLGRGATPLTAFEELWHAKQAVDRGIIGGKNVAKVWGHIFEAEVADILRAWGFRLIDHDYHYDFYDLLPNE